MSAERHEETAVSDELILSPARMADAVGARWTPGVPAIRGELRIDSRLVTAGDAFLAIAGERFDGHEFLDAAVDSGAAAAVVARGRASDRLPCLEVDDPLDALHRFARAVRADQTARVVGITGSNGKTTTRSLVGTVLGPDRVLEPVANFNNHIGLPLTMTRLRPDHRWAVLELGMNHGGEIASLTELARPHVAVITNVGRAHVGPVGGVDAVRAAKVEIVGGVEPSGTIFVPAGDERLVADVRRAAEPRGVDVASVGTEANARVRVRVDGPDADGHFTVARADGPSCRLAMPGWPLASAATYALAISAHEGIDDDLVVRRIASFRGVPGRGRLRIENDITIVDDSYNANPESMSAALDTLRSLPTSGRRVAVLGDMAELGSEADRSHADLGRQLQGIDVVVAVGDAMSAAAADWPLVDGDLVVCASRATAATELRGRLVAGDVVLFKGSRSAGLDRLIVELFDTTDGEG